MCLTRITAGLTHPSGLVIPLTVQDAHDDPGQCSSQDLLSRLFSHSTFLSAPTAAPVPAFTLSQLAPQALEDP